MTEAEPRPDASPRDALSVATFAERVLDEVGRAVVGKRDVLALVPMPITYVAVRGLDADLAPPWLWTVASLGTVGLLVVTARLTQPEPE